MKRSVIELIVILLLVSIIYIKDMFLYKESQIKLIETIVDQDLNNHLNDYSNLLKEHNLIKQPGYKCITRIKNRKINNFYNYVLIFNNQNCNLKENDIVLNDNGLIGIVSSVYNHYAKVSLINNNNINISVRINDNYGTLKSNKDKLYISELVNNNSISLKDKVYTSGLTKIPKDILIGEVSNITNKSIEIKAYSNILDNPYVSIYGE